MFGRFVEAEMNEAEERTTNAKMKAGARQRALTNILNATDRPDDESKERKEAPPAPASKFRDPATMFKKK